MSRSLTFRVNSRRCLYLPAQGRIAQSLAAESLRRKVTTGRHIQALRVTLRELGNSSTSYHIYRGGHYLGFSLPKEHAVPGQTVRAEIQCLTKQDFVTALRPLALAKDRRLKWIADTVVVTKFELVGDNLRLHIGQNHPLCGLSDFRLNGRKLAFPGISSQYGGVYLEFGITDYAQRIFRFRVRDNGFSQPSLQYPAGGKFKSVWMLSYDGFRLLVTYGPNRSTTTIYLRAPNEEMYRLGTISDYEGKLLRLMHGKYSRAFAVDSEILRRVEISMFKHNLTYLSGRLGAEISYLIASVRLGFDEVMITEPARGGRDPFTRDGEVSSQCRLLKEVPSDILTTAAQIEMYKLVAKVRQDFHYNETMNRGFAILSLKTDERSVRSIIAEIPRTM